MDQTLPVTDAPFSDPTRSAPSSSGAALSDTLRQILAAKYLEVQARQQETPLGEMERRARDAGRPRPFTAALCNAVAEMRVGLIAEVKRASPSGGLIREPFDPAGIARAYEAAGAACLSVLTDEQWFQGTREHLRLAREATQLPVLRKDFMVDPWQVFEARAMGADAILIIMAAVTDEMAERLEDTARGLDMGVLVEVHDEAELQRALGLETRLIGVNNRDLRSLTTDIAVTERLAPLIPADRIPVAESGIRTPEDVRRMVHAGARCLLVGEHLLRQPDPGAAARALVEAA
ncbi:indole-3-glycerol phosphate synthase TrpC [Roseomonas indoligenes]|uniref:Indole-3-glycerol phosphate synthase n=1 Tax=Roseomonas indoligenes TaxID=2820811 RepID=A0A940MV99_9PROT|nr:indole-3-glycerol phosphate synthase TrpC [Pararoseomonas indoligenes]MBP0492353.1 indole-3-glycerol phosphate synthase TrpC [Pararoseomonas indoligenes]